MQLCSLHFQTATMCFLYTNFFIEIRYFRTHRFCIVLFYIFRFTLIKLTFNAKAKFQFTQYSKIFSANEIRMTFKSQLNP